jgi:DNA/RNA-binding domain of Phe-tRNA-synthetase-like protein
LQVHIHENLKNLVRLGVLELEELQLPRDGGDALWACIEAHGRRIQEAYGGLSAGQVPGVEEARRLYRSVGIDPTKHRPSSEALVRRLIQNKPLYRIHPLVDLFNLASLEALLPVGLYDTSKIVGKMVEVRLGGVGAGFDGIRKDRVNVEGRLCIADALGPFGSPTSDSLRTCIEGDVPATLAVFFGPLDGDRKNLERALARSVELAQAHFEVKVAQREVLAASVLR